MDTNSTPTAADPVATPETEPTQPTTPDGAGNQPGHGDGGQQQPGTVTMTQAQLDALFNKFFASAMAKAEKKTAAAAQPPAASAPSQQPADAPAGDNAAAQAQAALHKAHHLLQNAALQVAAVQAGFVDPSDALALADRSLLTLDDEGAVTGADKAVEAIAKAKPHLMKPRNHPPVGGAVSTGAIDTRQKLPGQIAAEKARARQKNASEAAKAWQNG